MQVHSLKLSFQDIVSKDGAKLAVVLGTLYLDNKEPELEKINFTTAISTNPKLKTVIQEMIVEALTLKNLQIAKENGTLTHFVEAMGVNTRPVPRKRVSKVRNKK